MLVTVLGILTRLNPLPSNALFPIVVTELTMLTLVSF